MRGAEARVAEKANGAMILEGYRTPFVKAWKSFRRLSAVDLARIAVTELLYRTETRPSDVDETILGNVAGPPDAANIARVVALRSGIPDGRPALTVQRNCASGLEAVAQAAARVRGGDADLIVAGGVESMSQIPLLYSQDYPDFLMGLARARGLLSKARAALRFRPRHVLRPVIGLEVGLTDPVSGLNMGDTAEVLAREFQIDREEQDRFAQSSHERASRAIAQGRLGGEVIPVPVPPRYKETVESDIGPRANSSLEGLGRLKPYFDKKTGTVTAGNSSQITDGAAVCLVASPDRARLEGRKPLGRIRAAAAVGLDPKRMGLGPVYAAPVALRRAGLDLAEMGLIEINEAFAAQVLACLKAFGSDEFAQRELNLPKAVGEINPDILNVNGGAIALGHPVGASGARLIITLLKEMARLDVQFGLATLCVGGGQGVAMVLERP